MKTPYYRNPNSFSGNFFSPSGALTIFILVGVIVVLLLLRAFAPGVLVSIATPAWRAGSSLSASVSNTLNLETRTAILEGRDREFAKNQELVSQNAVLTTRVSDLERMLGVRAEVRSEILASVLARPPVSSYDTLVLDKGEQDGITEGAHVFGPGGIPAGTVSSVAPRNSRVTLYSSSGMETVGWAGKERTPLTLIGSGAGAYETTVSKDAGLVVGDNIYIGAGGAAPIGTIVNIESDPSSPTVILHIRPFINPFTLTFVTVAQ